MIDFVQMYTALAKAIALDTPPPEPESRDPLTLIPLTISQGSYGKRELYDMA
jgi:hypothetical protein